jgi:DNA-binding transcriptional MerR regulator
MTARFLRQDGCGSQRRYLSAQQDDAFRTCREAKEKKPMQQSMNDGWQVKDLAARNGVTPDVVRYYTRIGLLQPQRAGQWVSVYGRNDERHLQFIVKAKRLGYTLQEIETLLEEARKGRSPCPSARHILRDRVTHNRQQLDALLALQNRIERALAAWDSLPDRLPDGDAICHLIEQFIESE